MKLTSPEIQRLTNLLHDLSELENLPQLILEEIAEINQMITTNKRRQQSFQIGDTVSLRQQEGNLYGDGKVIGFPDNHISVDFKVKSEKRIENLWVKPEEILLIKRQSNS